MTPRNRIASARLYLVCDARPREFLAAAIRGGVDIVQLRDKALDDDELVVAAREFRAAADAGGALFVLNDRPDLVAACGADGVHVGQDDMTPADARAVVGPDAIVGRSTHAPEQAREAEADPDVDYLAVGPVHATPTKPGRPGRGARLRRLRRRQRRASRGSRSAASTRATSPRSSTLGATRIVVVRAIAGADDPEAAARELRAALEGPVGAAQP